MAMESVHLQASTPPRNEAHGRVVSASRSRARIGTEPRNRVRHSLRAEGG